MQYCASCREQVAVAIIYRRIEQYIRYVVSNWILIPVYSFSSPSVVLGSLT